VCAAAPGLRTVPALELPLEAAAPRRAVQLPRGRRRRPAGSTTTASRRRAGTERSATVLRPRGMAAVMTAVELRVADGLTGLLLRAQSTEGIPQRVSAKAAEYLNQPTIPFRAAQEICVAVRAAHGGEGPWLHELAAGTPLQLPTPPQRVKSKELQARLALLQKEQEKREYARMVADITGAERAAAARSDPAVLGYRESVGFGLNTIVTSGVLFMLFQFAGKRLSSDRGMQLLAGIVGLFLGIVLQCTLLLIRSYRADLRAAVAARGPGRQHRAARPAPLPPPPPQLQPPAAMDGQTKKTQ